jgi:thiol-disulfide isomerase/thioredoxin
MRFPHVASLLLLLAAPAGAEVRGVVVTPEGDPASNTALLLVEPDDGPIIDNGRIGNLYGADLTSTDAQGRFAFDVEPEHAYRVIALNDGGYGETPVLHVGDDDVRIDLGPWARLEVLASVGGSPVGGAEIHVQRDESLAENWNITPVASHWGVHYADADGKLVLDKLTPGRWKASQGVAFSPGGRLYPSHGLKVDLAAGDLGQLVLGGTGRAVVGRVDMPDVDPPARATLGLLQNDWSPADSAQTPTYGEVQAMSQRDREAFAETEAFRTYAEALRTGLETRRFFSVTVQPDGSLRADDVLSGEYFFYVEVQQPGDGGVTREVERTIVVPEGDEPFDLGTLALSRVVNLAVGDEVPDVTFEDVDGRSYQLSDFRGRYVLLDAWATWCGPCIFETPNVLALQETFKDDDRLVIIGLSMDADQDAARRYAQSKGLTWINGFIGPHDVTDVDNKLGIGGIPDIRLIGPDGKLIASGLRGDEMIEAVETALTADAE